MKKRSVAIVLSLVLVFCCAVGGVLAWLTDVTAPVTNTFTVGNIDIRLDETTGEKYKMVPGNTITKDPNVIVEAGSEACWLFVKVDKGGELDEFIAYNLDGGWTQLKDDDGKNVKGVYYREVDAATEEASFGVLSNNQVTVKEDVTKDMMDKLTIETQPTLTFTAYACQKENIANAPDAWKAIQGALSTTPAA